MTDCQDIKARWRTPFQDIFVFSQLRKHGSETFRRFGNSRNVEAYSFPNSITFFMFPLSSFRFHPSQSPRPRSLLAKVGKISMPDPITSTGTVKANWHILYTSCT